MKLKSLLLGAAMAAAFASVSALTVTPGSVPQVDSALVRNPCDPTIVGSPSGSPVLGCLNGNLSQTISISSDESLEIAGGAAILDSTDGLFSQLTFSATAPGSLSTARFDIDAAFDGFVTFADGSGTSSSFALDDAGQNFFTLTGITGNFLTVVSYTLQMSEADFIANVTDIRLGVVGGAVPEPGTYALMLAGLGAVGFATKRARQKSG